MERAKSNNKKIVQKNYLSEDVCYNAENSNKKVFNNFLNIKFDNYYKKHSNNEYQSY